MGGQSQSRLALNRTRQGSVKCFRRVIHWPVARRVAQRDAVPLTATYSGRARSVACRLQHQSAPLAARVDEPGHLRSGPAVRCASLHRRLRFADRYRPTGQCRSPDSNRQWIKLRGQRHPSATELIATITISFIISERCALGAQRKW